MSSNPENVDASVYVCHWTNYNHRGMGRFNCDTVESQQPNIMLTCCIFIFTPTEHPFTWIQLGVALSCSVRSQLKGEQLKPLGQVL